MASMLGRLFGVFGLIAVFHLAWCEDVLPKGLKCVSCTGRLSLLNCNEIETCEHDDEICYVEEVIDIGGQVVINAGCKKKAICDSKGCFNDVMRRKRDVNSRHRRQDTREQICHHCCDTNFCNMYGCSDTNEVDSFKGIRCVVCSLTFDPNLCTKIQNCEEGEYCYTSLNVRATGTDTVVKRFTTGCMKSNVCEKLEKLHLEHASARKKRSYTEIYSECCKSHLCNRNIPLAVDLPQRESDTYVCPARTITTESTTKATVKPFALADVCEDKINNCHEYGADYICTGDFLPWAKINCRKFCQLCDPCEDKIAECPAYGYEYICKGDYIPWSLINCRKFCNLCSVSPPQMDLTAPATSTKENGMYSTESSTTQYSKATTTSVSTKEPCEDMDYNCADYGYDYICSGDFIQWSNIHCRKFCNLCDNSSAVYFQTAMATPVATSDLISWSNNHCRKVCNMCGSTSTTGTTTMAECRDKLDNCAAYGRNYICTGDYIPWSLINCPLFCGLCAASTTGTTTMAECRDKLDNCAAYGRDYICTGDYIPWSLINCPLFCGLCAAASSSPTTLSSTQSSLSVQVSDTSTRATDRTDHPQKTSARTQPNITQPQTSTGHDSETSTAKTTTASTTDETTSTTDKTTEQTTLRTTRVPSTSSKIHTTALLETTKYVSNTTTAITEASSIVTTETASSSTSTASAKMNTTIEASTTGKPCADTLDCSVYSIKLVCHGEFLNWAYQHCSKYCGFCKDQSETSTKTTTSTESTPISSSPTTSTSTTTSAPITTANDPSCQDVVNCAGLESKCGDVTQHIWLYQNCRRTCQMCHESPLCVDEIHDCASLASLICDLGLNPELKPQCKKTCKLC